MGSQLREMCGDDGNMNWGQKRTELGADWTHFQGCTTGDKALLGPITPRDFGDYLPGVVRPPRRPRRGCANLTMPDQPTPVFFFLSIPPTLSSACVLERKWRWRWQLSCEAVTKCWRAPNSPCCANASPIMRPLPPTQPSVPVAV